MEVHELVILAKYAVFMAVAGFTTAGVVAFIEERRNT